MGTTEATNLIAIVALVASFVSAVGVATLTVWLTARNSRTELRRQRTKDLLENFYGPLSAILIENSVLYEGFGPKRFLGRSPEVAFALGEAWTSIKESVVLPNLQEVKRLIQRYWVPSGAKTKKYLAALMLHCTAFCEYDKAPNELYKNYKYDPDWLKSIEQEISRLRAEVGDE